MAITYKITGKPTRTLVGDRMLDLYPCSDGKRRTIVEMAKAVPMEISTLRSRLSRARCDYARVLRPVRSDGLSLKGRTRGEDRGNSAWRRLGNRVRTENLAKIKTGTFERQEVME